MQEIKQIIECIRQAIEKIIFIIGENNISSEYISIIIGGLFGITTIMVAIFSLISNDVTKKTSGFSLINLKRYKIWLLLLPIYLVFIMSFIMMFFPECNNIIFLFFGTIIILIIVTVQSYYILQPIYKQNKCKKAIIKNKINGFKSIIKKTKTIHDIKKILEKEKMELFKLISIDNKDNNYIKIDDKKMIFKSFLNIVNEKIKDPNLDIDIIFIEIGLNIFGNDFLIFVNEYDFPEVLLLEAFLSKNEKQFNIEFHKKNLELIHTMFESHKSGTPIEKIYNAEQLNLFLIQTIMNPLAINYVLNYIFDTSNWSYKDLEFIKLLLRIFSNSFNTISYIYENSLDKKTFDRFKKVMISFNSKEKLNEENDEFDKRFNLMVKTLKEV